VRALATIAACGLLLLAGCDSDDGSEGPAKPLDLEALAGSPAPLAKLHAQSGELIDGGREGFEARIRSLRGHPAVVNKWASWCGPCRVEFPYFRDQGLKRGKEIAFIGVNSNDNDGEAKDFLADNPVPFPSYRDPKLEVAASFNAVQAFPATAFYDAKGELAYVHQGAYASEAKLAEDIQRYAR
jgi:cytochrome c biogenesis protein CcmG, thiol:disulfide interchange protein DsbE